MPIPDIIKIAIAVIVGIFLIYIAVRIWTYGIFRSYFEAKKQQHKEEEESDAKTKQTKF